MDDRQLISLTDALNIIERDESQLWDHKSARSSGDVIQKIGVALANAEGGGFVVGVEDKRNSSGIDRWQGFADIEESTFIHEALARDCNPAIPYTFEYLEIDGEEARGLACLVNVPKSADVHHSSSKKCFVRRSASTVQIHGQAVTDLQLAKGAKSYEDQLLSEYLFDEWAQEGELANFLAEYSPRTSPEALARRERLIDAGSKECRVAAAVLFSEHPSGVVPKRCAVKIVRYNTAGQPTRENLDGTPITVTGPARLLIEETLDKATKIINAVPVLEPDGSFKAMEYPPEALKEIVVNAVIHRDYNISDDVLVSIFDNRVEVRSPGGLPGQMTLDVLFKERASRNTKILRLLNGYADPPNQDIGEGLTTVRESMAKARLREPKFAVDGNYFVATLPHEKLARPEELVMEYLVSHPSITNKIGRGLSGIQSENTMKEVFYSLRDAGKIERVPGKLGNSAAWQMVI